MAFKILVLGAIIFIGTHLIPALGQSRAHLVNRLSLNGYKLLFTLLSVLGLGLMVWGKSTAPHSDIWFPPPWGRNAAMFIMFPSMVLLAVAKLPTNIKRVTPHPMMWGFILWAIAHLLANGDLSSIILFGSIGAYSITTTVPASRETISLAFGVLVYVGLLYLHPYLFGPKLV